MLKETLETMIIESKHSAIKADNESPDPYEASYWGGFYKALTIAKTLVEAEAIEGPE